MDWTIKVGRTQVGPKLGARCDRCCLQMNQQRRQFRKSFFFFEKVFFSTESFRKNCEVKDSLAYSRRKDFVSCQHRNENDAFRLEIGFLVNWNFSKGILIIIPSYPCHSTVWWKFVKSLELQWLQFKRVVFCGGISVIKAPRGEILYLLTEKYFRYRV